MLPNQANIDCAWQQYERSSSFFSGKEEKSKKSQFVHEKILPFKLLLELRLNGDLLLSKKNLENSRVTEDYAARFLTVPDNAFAGLVNVQLILCPLRHEQSRLYIFNKGAVCRWCNLHRFCMKSTENQFLSYEKINHSRSFMTLVDYFLPLDGLSNTSCKSSLLCKLLDNGTCFNVIGCEKFLYFLDNFSVFVEETAGKGSRSGVTLWDKSQERGVFCLWFFHNGHRFLELEVTLQADNNIALNKLSFVLITLLALISDRLRLFGDDLFNTFGAKSVHFIVHLSNRFFIFVFKKCNSK